MLQWAMAAKKYHAIALNLDRIGTLTKWEIVPYFINEKDDTKEIE